MGSPRETKIDLITYDVEFEGGKLPPNLNIRSISVNLTTKGIPKANLVIVNGSDDNLYNFNFTDEGMFTPGKEVSISAGYHLNNKLIFKGVITEKGVKIKGISSFEMSLSCEDKANALTKTRMNTSYKDKTDTQMIQEALSRSGFSGKIASSSYMHPENMQYNSTDWDFIVSRAESAGKVVVVENGQVHVEEPGERGNAVFLTLGKDVKSMNLSVDTKNQVPKIKASSWDHEKHEVITEEYTSGLIKSKISSFGAGVDKSRVQQVHSTTKMAKGYLKQWAKAKAIKNELSRLRGSVSFQGTTDAVPNSYLMLTGFGKDLDGPAYIKDVKHNIAGGDWTTEVTIGEDAEEFSSSASNVSSPGAAGLTPSIQGTYTAKVMQIHDDPEGNNRIKVDVPIISQSADKSDGGSSNAGEVWSRISNQYASGDVGSFFLPEVGDEVMVSFLQNDPRHPVITGMAHSKVNASPYEPDEENTYKAIVTKSKMKIEFEDVKKIITISTPSGNIITISEDEKFITIVDENDNKVELKPEGINIESPKDITIKAKGKIEIESQKTIDIKGMQDVSMKSSSGNVDVKAGMSMTAEGSTSATLKGGASTTVKGAIVQIN